MRAFRRVTSSSVEQVLVVLDSVSAARVWLARATPAARLLSTHMSVVDFLATRGIACTDVSELITADHAAKHLSQASADLDAILEELDSSVALQACAADGLPRVRLFQATFKYLGQFNLAGMRCFESQLDATLAADAFAGVEFLHAVETSVDAVFSFVDAAARVCAARQVAFVSTAVSRPTPPRLRSTASLALRAIRSPRVALERISGVVRRALAPGLRAHAPAVLLFDPEPNSYFERALAGTHLVYITRGGHVRGAERFREEARIAATRIRSALEGWLHANPARCDGIAGRCVAHLARSARELLEPMIVAYRIAASFPILAAAWDVPLVTRAPLNLMAEALLAAGVRVFGRQHGGNYVDQRADSIHFDSDFDRCTHYFSYGFGAAEFRQAYPNRRPRCVFEPGGNARPRAARRKSVDIAFPIGGCMPLFYLLRMPEGELVRRQRAVLSAMEARTDLDCVVKPPPGYSHDSFGLMETLAALRHTRVAGGTWTEFLTRSAPSLVVLETVSTPLYEALGYDVDVFLMLDPLYPFTEQATAMLRRRVHVFDTAEQLAAAILRYGREATPRLRDNSYYDTYVNRGSAARVRDVLGSPAAQLDYRLIP